MNQNLTDGMGSLPILNLKGTTRNTDTRKPLRRLQGPQGTPPTFSSKRKRVGAKGPTQSQEGNSLA